MLAIEPGPSWQDLRTAVFRRSKVNRDGDIRFVGSGKAAIRLIFEFLKKRGVLEHKMIPVFVPPWLGTWVYAEMLPFAFPSLNAAGAKAMLCYHQYGFPQNMDRVLDMAASRDMVVIEDCAHAAASEYKGRAIGTFGEFALYSFSKFTFCFAFGGVTSRHDEFYAFVDEVDDGASAVLRALINGFKLVDEANLHLSRRLAPTAMNGLRKMAYSRYGDQVLPGARAIALWQHKKSNEIQARRSNYALLRQEIDGGVCNHLETDGVAPYAVPLAVASDKTNLLVSRLRASGISADTCRFDFARCSFEPDFRKCVVVPIHSGMTGDGMHRLISCLRQAL